MSSTYQAQQQLLNRIVTALSGLAVRGLVTLGPGLRDGEVTGAPNVAVVPSASHAAALPDADAVITHAGHGTVIKALAAGVPLVCLPHGRDQADNAARVVAAGTGLRLSRDSDASAISQAAQRVLLERPFRDNARRMARAIAEDPAGGATAVAEVEALLSLASSRSGPG